MVLADRFTQIFREEHRTVRDALLELIKAFQAKDSAWVQSLLTQAAAFVGPHFRYEEEALYPALDEIFGPDYIQQLVKAHDGAIGGAQRLVQLAGKGSLNDRDVAEATRIVRGILPHVSDCDGLSIMVERLADEKVQRVFDARSHALAEGLDLLRWAKEVRGRSI